MSNAVGPAPVKINWYVSRCSESFLENAPDARWGVARPTGIVSGLPLSSDRHVECWMHINLCPISEFNSPRRGASFSLPFSLPFSPLFSYSRRLADVRRGISFRYHVCSYDSRCTGLASQVNRFCGFLEWKYCWIGGDESLPDVRRKGRTAFKEFTVAWIIIERLESQLDRGFFTFCNELLQAVIFPLQLRDTNRRRLLIAINTVTNFWLQKIFYHFNVHVQIRSNLYL